MISKKNKVKSDYMLNQYKQLRVESNREIRQFMVYYDNKIFHIKLHHFDYVQNLINQIKNRLYQLHYTFTNLWLQSLNKNSIIDYLINQPKQQVNIFSDKQSFKCVTNKIKKCQKQIQLSDYIFVKCLGKGSSGIVYMVRNKFNGKVSALKQILKQSISNFKGMQKILRQKKIMENHSENSSFLLKLQATFESQEHLNFLLQFCPGGELFFHMLKKKFSQQQVKFFAAQIIQVFSYLHKNNIIYRDLKPQNVLLDIKGHIKLADFGCCKINFLKNQFSDSFCGNIDYMAPEVAHKQKYNYSAQFYAIGSFIYQLMVGSPPQVNNNQLYFEREMSKQMRNIILKLLQFNPEKRLQDFDAIKRQKWFSNIDWDKVNKKSIKSPIKINIKQQYIHKQFLQIKVNHLNQVNQKKYDRLFSMFQYKRSISKSTDSKNHFPHLQNKQKPNKLYFAQQTHDLYFNQSISKKIRSPRSKSTKKRYRKQNDSNSTSDVDGASSKGKYEQFSIEKTESKIRLKKIVI